MVSPLQVIELERYCCQFAKTAIDSCGKCYDKYNIIRKDDDSVLEVIYKCKNVKITKKMSVLYREKILE